MPCLLRNGSEGSKWYLTGSLLGTVSHSFVRVTEQIVICLQEESCTAGQ